MDKKTKNGLNFIFAGGGTGGHLFPLVAVAEKIKLLQPSVSILFVGTKNKIESRVIPNLGYSFYPLTISGMPRKIGLDILVFAYRLFVSVIKSLWLCIKYKPDVAIGSGAYVSGPVIWSAKLTGAKVFLLEQNSYPGITNRLLEKKADKIYISFKDSEKYFRFKDKLVLYGNPLRININKISQQDAKMKFGFANNNPIIFVSGGSLGAKTINQAIAKNIEKLNELNVNIIWQCGNNYINEYSKYASSTIKVYPFITDMGEAYSAANLVIARAGATTIAEVSYLGLPVIFIPSPNVTDNHQYKNAKALEEAEAAILIKDEEAENSIVDKIKDLISNSDRLLQLSNNIKKFAGLNAADKIGTEILEAANNKNRI